VSTAQEALAAVWSHVPGQRHAVALLAAAARRPVHAYLFVGPPGVGKREAARAFAAALLCPAGGDGTCRDCRLALAGTHPDLREVERVGAAISKPQAEEIVRAASRSPVEGDRKVLVLHDFHLVRPEAAAALLKTIEEPPASTVFVVLADDVTPDLVTIASRCLRVDFHALDATAIALVLEADGVAPAAALAAAELAGGSLDAARLLVADDQAAVRRHAFATVAGRLDGTGATVARIVDELVGLIDAATEPLVAQQSAELDELEERVKLTGERGAGRRELEAEHKRQVRRLRTDELRAGLGAIAAAYRDALVSGRARDVEAIAAAVTAVHRALEALDRNVNEVLLLQALLLQLPSVPSSSVP
jgi:DNA polymerase-3 subunit delta'